MRKHLLMIILLFMATTLAFGCVITIGDGSGSSDSDSESSATGAGQPPPPAPPLPNPTEWRVTPATLTPEQQQRKDEVDHYLEEQFRDYNIVEAIQGWSGDITYWVDSSTLPVPSLPDLPWTAEGLTPPAGAELACTELEQFPELRGPAWTTPIHRPDFSAYIMGETGATSLQDYLDNYQVSGQPSGQDRLYGGIFSPQPNRGVSASINQFAGDVEQGTFSLIELAVACPVDGPMVEQIGIAISIDKTANSFGDGKPRLHVEFMTQGGNKFGPRIGGWDERKEGFVPFPGRLYGPGETVAVSEPGLGSQQEHRIDIVQDLSGNWWIAHNGNVLGHYPASLFQMLNKGACVAAWYGEVYDPTPDDWTWTNMGSGEFPTAGYGYASYVRDPMYLDPSYIPLYPIDDAVNIDKYSVKPLFSPCYTRSTLTIGIPPWSRYVHLGGPGGDAPGCD